MSGNDHSCPYCGRAFRSVDRLAKHIWHAHKDEFSKRRRFRPARNRDHTLRQ